MNPTKAQSNKEVGAKSIMPASCLYDDFESVGQVKGLDFELLRKANKRIAIEEQEKLKEQEASEYALRFDTDAPVDIKNGLVSSIMEVINFKKEAIGSALHRAGTSGVMLYSYDITTPIETPSDMRTRCLPTLLICSGRHSKVSKVQSQESRLVVNSVAIAIRKIRRKKIMAEHSLKKVKPPKLADLLKKREQNLGQVDPTDTPKFVDADPDDDIFPT